jgi:hypothetical protein
MEEFFTLLKNARERNEARKTLSRVIDAGEDVVMTRHAFIKKEVEAGARVKEYEGNLVLMRANGEAHKPRLITKHGLNYAAWLSIRMRSDKEAQIRRMIEVGYEHLYGHAFDMRTITSNGYSRFHCAATDILTAESFKVFYNRFAGYPLDRKLTMESRRYRKLYEAMQKAM